MFMKLFGREQTLGDQAAKPPARRPWNPSGYRDYRSPTKLSDGSEAPSPDNLSMRPVSWPVKGGKDNVVSHAQVAPIVQDEDGRCQSMSRTPRQQETKMRFSFILSEDESPRNSRNEKQPSLVVDNELSSSTLLQIGSSPETENSILSPENAARVLGLPLDREDRGMSPASANRRATGAVVEYYVPSGTPPASPSEEMVHTVRSTVPYRPRRSSSLRRSEHFDTVEDVDVPEKLGTIKEDKDAESSATLNAQDTPKPTLSAPRNPFTDGAVARNASDSKVTDAIPDQGFEDEPEVEDERILVMRSNSLNHNTTTRCGHYQETTTLPCTRATFADTVHYKRLALSLLQYRESESIYSSLMTRLERMHQMEPTLAAREHRRPMPIDQLARKLRNFVRTTAQARIETGEFPKVVRHEGEWVEWIYGAAKRGVLHAPGNGCTCRAEWRWED